MFSFFWVFSSSNAIIIIISHMCYSIIFTKYIGIYYYHYHHLISLEHLMVLLGLFCTLLTIKTNHSAYSHTLLSHIFPI